MTKQMHIPLERTRIHPLHTCESCSKRMAKNKLDMPGGPTFEVCDVCVDAFRA